MKRNLYILLSLMVAISVGLVSCAPATSAATEPLGVYEFEERFAVKRPDWFDK